MVFNHSPVNQSITVEITWTDCMHEVPNTRQDEQYRKWVTYIATAAVSPAVGQQVDPVGFWFAISLQHISITVYNE